jgi:phosphohistidine phosphatase SixA
MNIYLIRSGDAEPPSATKPHEERELTAPGIKILKASAEYWKKYISGFDMMFSSPLKRAMQSAMIIKDAFKLQTELMEEVSLMNGGLTEDLIALINSFNVNEIAMVGHYPDVWIHISNMTCSGELNVYMPNAGIAKIFFDGKPDMGKGILQFLIPPVK